MQKDQKEFELFVFWSFSKPAVPFYVTWTCPRSNIRPRLHDTVFISYRIGFISDWPSVYMMPFSFQSGLASCLHSKTKTGMEATNTTMKMILSTVISITNVIPAGRGKTFSCKQEANPIGLSNENGIV